MKNPILIQVAMEVECQEILKNIEELEIVTRNNYKYKFLQDKH